MHYNLPIQLSDLHTDILTTLKNVTWFKIILFAEITMNGKNSQ